MSAPQWARALLSRAADPDRVDEAVGDLDEAHRLRIERHGRIVAAVLTGFEAIDMARALRKTRRSRQVNVSRVARSRGLPISALDFKLGIRMLVRYPGLTLVAGFAMAFTVWVGAGTFEFVTQVVRPKLPFEEANRIVALQLVQRENGEIDVQSGLDFLAWRDRLETVDNLGAFRSSFVNLIVDGEVGEPIVVAAMTASGFDLARVPPQLGRFLFPSDESDVAGPVVVLSHELWQSRFLGDPDVIGRTVGLGNEQPTIVGVMPERFGFPFVQDVWTPLRTSALQGNAAVDRSPSGGDFTQRSGSAQVFARLRDAATVEELEAELSLYVTQMASELPDPYRDLVPSVMPHALSFLGVTPETWSTLSLGFLSFNVVPILLLLLIAANVALLMFARAATRESEIAVRTALGAGRARIVGQLFAEALVLGAIAAGIGLAAASFGLRWVFGMVSTSLLDAGQLPFWFHASLSPMTIVYAVLFTLVGAALAGVLPGLKVTRGLATRLRESSAGGGGLQFGGVWTAVIVTQVAFTVPVPTIVYGLLLERSGIESVTIGVPVHEYLAARVELEGPTDDEGILRLERYSTNVAELEERLEADDRVRAVTVTDRLPRDYHPWNLIEVLEGATEPPDERGHRVGRANVALDFFDAFEVPILTGRGFGSGDQGAEARVVIVNESFVDRVLGGRNAVGRHVRYVSSESAREPRFDGPWYEIVGVVRDLGAASGYGPQGIYHPLDPARYPVYVVAHVLGDPLEAAPMLREAALAVDPALEIHDPISLADVVRGDLELYDFWITLIVAVAVIALLLSLAGIYAVMSFAVSRRTREIGIRVALGGSRRGIVTSIFRRPLLQVAGGLLLGTTLTASLFATLQGSQFVFVALYVVLMTGVTMSACIVPTRRALGIEPTEALRAE